MLEVIWTHCMEYSLLVRIQSPECNNSFLPQKLPTFKAHNTSSFEVSGALTPA